MTTVNIGVRMSAVTPMVGIGIIIINQQGQILIGKRKNSHAPYYSIPGGHMELGETFSQCAIREVEEETGLTIDEPQVIAVTNNLATYHESGKHYISVALLATKFSGELTLKEPDKCEGWLWVDPTQVPSPQFDASEQSIQCYLEQRFCINE
ncbi:nucleotide triphosphate diphosphatase NUDT15 [Photobacterium aquimaris]|nr:NUDIX domain-containing protein [Photobacterium aquimaris]